MPIDPRAAEYTDLHSGQMAQQEAQNRISASIILRLLFDYVAPTSMLDVGCGLGTWLSVAKELGVNDIYGIEGQWLDRSKLAVDPNLVKAHDLEQFFSLGRSFGLVSCLEVAEHISEPAAAKLVSSLTQHGDLILFSAAIPFQGGHHHVNERFADYWALLFQAHGFRVLDFIRPRIWTDPAVLWWFKQNTLIFAHDRLLADNEKLRQEQSVPRMLSVVHPDVYIGQLQHAHKGLFEYQRMLQMLSSGGTFSVTRLLEGQLKIDRITRPS